ncbi:MAG: hypothetical protein AB1480_11720 [Nitrospirota bacterium]
MKFRVMITNRFGLILLAMIFFAVSCKVATEQEKITPVSQEYAFNKVEEFCKQFKIDCKSKKLDGVFPANYFYMFGLHVRWDEDYFRGAHVLCEQTKDSPNDKYVHFLVRDKSKEIELYANVALYEMYMSKRAWYKKTRQSRMLEFMPEDKAKQIFNSLAKKLQIPSDMVFEKINKNDPIYGSVWSAVWLRKRNDYRYEGDAISISIMGATGEFVAYTKTYRGVPCSTEMKISKEQAIEIGWKKLQKYFTWKMKKIGEKARALYEVNAEPLIIQTGAFGRSSKPVKIKGSKLAWVIRYTFTGGFEKWKELGLPDEYFEVRIDATTGRILYTSPMRPWFIRWFGELSVKK